MARVAEEAGQIARDKVDALKSLSWDELDAYGSRQEKVVSPAGRRLRVKSWAGWDMEPWASEIGITVKVYASGGFRRFVPITARGGRGGPDDLIPERPR
jgi:hypothetical protein